MTVAETLLVFVVIPLGLVGLAAFAVYGKSLLQAPNRYRPGRPWNYEPSWYVPHPGAVRTDNGHKELESAAESATTAVGGASGEW